MMAKIYTFMIALTSIFSFCGCARQLRTAEQITTFSYHVQGMTCYGETYSVKRVENHAVVEFGFYQEPIMIEADTSIFTDLQAIIDKYKVHHYKKSYRPTMEISDGETWSLQVCYTRSELNITSGGCNAWPKNDGNALNEFRAYFLTKFQEQQENKAE